MGDQSDNTEGGSTLNHLYDWVTGKMTPKGGSSPHDPNKVPMGSGMAEKARGALKGRQKSIDDAIAEAGG